MFNKKNKANYTLSDLKKLNNEVGDLLKEILKEAKKLNNQVVVDEINSLNIDINYKSVLIKSLNEEKIKDEITLTLYIKDALLDAQELLKKGTNYGIQLAVHRINDMLSDRQVASSVFLVEEYYKFEKNLWSIIKLRELAYGEIQRLKSKQDKITLSALNEADSMMRVRYFEDIRVLEKDILRLENEAHDYDTVQAALHSEQVLKEVLKKSSLNKIDLLEVKQFEDTVLKYGRNQK